MFTKRSSIILSVSLCILCTVFIQCKNKEVEKSSSPNAVATPTQPGTKVSGIPGELMSKLLNECNGIDYSFKTMSISMNLSDAQSILNNIAYLDINQPISEIPADCKPIARKFFKLKDGKTIDADVYLDRKCKFYAIIGEDGKPKYANAMTDIAVKNYASLARQAREAADGTAPNH